MHKIKNKRAGQTSLCTVKLDVHKAYDRVKCFFRNMMLKLGFHEHLVDMMMACVSSMQYKVGNSQETEKFTPTRGIRQREGGSPHTCFYCQKVCLPCCGMKKLVV